MRQITSSAWPRSASAWTSRWSKRKRLAGKNMIPPSFIIKTHARLDAHVPRRAAGAERAGHRAGAEDGCNRSLAPEQRTKLQAEATRLVGAEVYPAWDRAIKLLESIQPKATDDAGLWRYKGGADAYAFFLGRFTTTDFTAGADSPDRPASRSRASKAQMDTILKQLGRTEGSVRERIEKLRNDLRYPDPTSEASRAAIMKDTNAFIEDALKRSPSLFDLQPKTHSDRAAVPALPRSQRRRQLQPRTARRLAAGDLPDPAARAAHDQVRPAHAGVSRDRAGSSLPDRARAGEHEPAAFRQARVLGGISALSEGWALYAEKLVAENGWYDGDPEGMLGMLDAQLFRARRLVVDTGLHAKHWTRQQAIDYGIEASEIERYVVNPGQACAYMIGQLKLARAARQGAQHARCEVLAAGVPRRRAEDRHGAARHGRGRSGPLHPHELPEPAQVTNMLKRSIIIRDCTDARASRHGGGCSAARHSRPRNPTSSTSHRLRPGSSTGGASYSCPTTASC